MRLRVSRIVFLALVGSAVGLGSGVLAQGIPNSPTGKIAKALARFTATSGEAALESDGQGAIIVFANLDPPIAGHISARLREVALD